MDSKFVIDQQFKLVYEAMHATCFRSSQALVLYISVNGNSWPFDTIVFGTYVRKKIFEQNRVFEDE